MKTTTKPYTIRLKDEVKEALEAQAAREDRPAAQVAARAVEAMLRAKEAKRAAIKAAMVEADKGMFVSEEAMTAWVMSWGTDDELPVPEPDINLNRA